MKRSVFLKSLATFIAAPSLVSMVDEKPVINEEPFTDIEQLRKMPLELGDCYYTYTPKKILDTFQETGVLICKDLKNIVII